MQNRKTAECKSAKTCWSMTNADEGKFPNRDRWRNVVSFTTSRNQNDCSWNVVMQIHHQKVQGATISEQSDVHCILGIGKSWSSFISWNPIVTVTSWRFKTQISRFRREKKNFHLQHDNTWLPASLKTTVYDVTFDRTVVPHSWIVRIWCIPTFIFSGQWKVNEANNIFYDNDAVIVVVKKWVANSGASWIFTSAAYRLFCSSLVKMHSQWWWYLYWKITFCSWKLAMFNGVIAFVEADDPLIKNCN